ncbi:MULTISPECIES: hypothetical protein [unclassified Pseudomonas]|uniref:hypothetical protein n=1 Tax=unclassified Pseudomonas TaxID=196821 RepID=UPI001472FBC7|nr:MULTISPECIES: hypothetical protein [unclassified Pseudomonas]NMY36179.1 hypothetical protein [Pseudomonas sp. WS 5078]NMY58920.1 hypothetical protein [Pseudomonas sp. WS 5354]
MTLESIALWLGYGLMITGGIVLIAAMLFVIGTVLAVIANKSLRALIRIYDLKTLRATMRQLEAEGKVSMKTGVKNG